MKKVIFILCATLMTGSLFGQEGHPRPERIKIVKGGESIPVKSSAKPKLSPAQELESCETQLEALNNKEAYLRSNPAELKLAEENGWFTDAAITRAQLERRIDELKIELKK